MSSLQPTEIESRNRVSRVLSLLRWKPFETSNAEGLARERHRRILLSTVASGLAKGVSILAGLIIVPMTLRYLGEAAVCGLGNDQQLVPGTKLC